MPSLREWLRRFWSTVRPSGSDADLDAELRAHLELAADESGTMQPAGLSQAMESLRDQRELPWLRDLVRDLRYGVLAVTLLATYIPTRRASRINPTEALRYE